MSSWRIVAALLACSVTAVMVSFPRLGPASKTGAPMDLSKGDTPARIQLDNLLRAFNSNDRGVIDDYRARHVSPYWPHAPTTDMALGWYKQTGGYELLRIDDVAPNYLLALLRNGDSDELFLMGVEVERDQPHRLVYLTLNYASKAPEEFRPQQMTDEETIAELRRQLARRVPAGKFSGAILVKRDDRILFREAFGFADRESQAPNTAETRFRIGRLTDMFTAVAVLRLAQDGKLDPADKLRRLLPQLAGEDAGEITLAQLLANHGGTGDLEHLGWRQDRRRRFSLDELVEEFGDADLLYRPGQQFRYSSLGYALLAAVVERVSARPYADYLREVVFRPAGMVATEFSGNPAGAGRAKPYRRPIDAADWSVMPELLCCRGTPSGDGYSTVDDIARFLGALESRRLLDDEHTLMMLEPRAFMWGRTFQGYGLAIEDHGESNRWLTHDDGLEGQNSGFMFRPDSGHLVVVLGNYDAPTAVQLARFVGNRLPSRGLVEIDLRLR